MAMKFFQRGDKAGLVVSESPDPTPEQKKAAQKWMAQIEAARKFDEAARKQYARDRKYARGDSGDYIVDVPIAGSYIHVLKSFLYARNPDLDVLPSEATEPPPENEIKRLVQAQVSGDPVAIARLKQIAEEELALGSPPAQAAAVNSAQYDQALQSAVTATQAEEARMVKQRHDAIMKPYHERFTQAKSLGQTLERVIRHLWEKARLKHEARLFTSSGLTVGVGWLKCTWQDETGEDPIVKGQMDDLKGQLERIAATQADSEDGPNTEAESAQADLQQQIEGLKPKLQTVKSRGLAIDFISAEDIQVSTDARYINGYLDASWLAQRVFMPASVAKAQFADLGDRINAATHYFPQKPADKTSILDSGSVAKVKADDADAYSTNQSEDAQASVAVWECWSKADGLVYTLIEGVEGWARAPYAPDPSLDRFYPFVLFAPVETDGDRHPDSLIKRSITLLDEYNRRMSRWSVICSRNIPKSAFDATQYSATEIAKLQAAADDEFVPLKPSRPGQPVGEALQPLRYPPFDGSLFDTAPLRAELEVIWGIQEALASSIQTAKTATEANIENQGSQSRLGYMREALDTAMNEIAKMSAEYALQRLEFEDVKEIAGPWAFWPQGLSGDALKGLVSVKIRASSTGQPDMAHEQKVWSEVLPLLREDIIQIGKLRGSTPQQIADSLEALAEETMRRTGEHMDVDRFIPGPPDDGGQTPQVPQGVPQPGAPPGSPTGVPQGAPQPPQAPMGAPQPQVTPNG